MARYTGEKNRIARRFGANVFGKMRNPLIHKPHPPGMHGSSRKKKSDYGVQLEEKQKLAACYGMLSRKQMIKYFHLATKLPGNTHEEFLNFLESRLDVVVHRLKFASTIFQAQQLVSHGHILVDGKKVDIRSFQVKPGMKITVKEKSKNLKLIKQGLERTAISVPEYLQLDIQKMSGEMLARPHVDQVPLPLVVNIALVCEFLAHTT